MADEFGDMIKNMLNDPGTMSKISEIIGSLGGGNNSGEQPEPEANSNPIDIDMILKLKGAYDSMMSNDDHKIALLLALRPYLSEKRRDRFDGMLKLVRLSKITELLKDLDIDLGKFF